MSALETGLNRPEELNAILEELNRKAELSEAQRFLTKEVWSNYHSSFEDNERKFTDAMVACFKQRSADLSIQSLNEAVSIMEELENNDVADELWRIYLEARPKLDPEYEWSQLPRYNNSSRVKKRLEELIETPLDRSSANIKRIIHKLIKEKGWDPRDIDVLGEYSRADWYQFFKTDLSGEKLRHLYIQRVLEFTSYQEKQYKEIGNRAEAAIKEIALESRINRVRVEGLGVKVD